ncbi:MAG TPA: TonB-dependent receptor plug domain-containing protein [Balneolaceae bacterium]
MKKLHLNFFMIAALFMILGCASTGETFQSSDEITAVNLAQYLRKVPGITVRGTGNDASVTIRKSVSFRGTTRPLFVLNGQVIGTSYSRIAGLVRVQDIDYVEVLKGPEAAAYGMRGSNGVILIVTRQQ